MNRTVLPRRFFIPDKLAIQALSNSGPYGECNTHYRRFLTGCRRAVGTSPLRSPLVKIVDGVPVRIPPLQKMHNGQDLPLIALAMGNLSGLDSTHMFRDSALWHHVNIPVNAPIMLRWRVRSRCPNTVNLAVFRHLPMAGQYVTPQEIVQSCMVNAIYHQEPWLRVKFPRSFSHDIAQNCSKPSCGNDNQCLMGPAIR